MRRIASQRKARHSIEFQSNAFSPLQSGLSESLLTLAQCNAEHGRASQRNSKNRVKHIRKSGLFECFCTLAHCKPPQITAGQRKSKQRGLAIGNSRFSGSLLIPMQEMAPQFNASKVTAPQRKATRKAAMLFRSF